MNEGLRPQVKARLLGVAEGVRLGGPTPRGLVLQGTVGAGGSRSISTLSDDKGPRACNALSEMASSATLNHLLSETRKSSPESRSCLKTGILFLLP